MRLKFNSRALVPCVIKTLHDRDLAIKVAGRLNLPEAENLCSQEFERLMSAGKVVDAAKLVAQNGGLLRTSMTMSRFQNMPAEPGSPPPVFHYYSTFLKTEKLNEQESLELARTVLQQGQSQLLEKWLRHDKLTCSEALGDLMMEDDVSKALFVYLCTESHSKAINCFIQCGKYEKIVPYSTSAGFKVDYSTMFNNLFFSNPQGALELAKCLVNAEEGPILDIQATAEALLRWVKERNAFSPNMPSKKGV